MATVAFLITELERGGAELALLRLVRGLDRRRFRPAAVFSLGDVGPVGRMIAASGVPVHPLRFRDRPIRAFAGLTRALVSIRPDILQTFLFHANVVGCLAGRMAGVPRVVASVRVTEVDRPWRAAVERVAYRGVDRVICVADAVRRHVHRTAGIPQARLVVIPNGVDLPAMPAPGLRPSGRSVLTVAHLREQKGIDILLRAIPDVLRTMPDAVFTVVGAGDSAPYRSLSVRLGVDRSVQFAGPADDVSAHLAGADCFVLPSRWEGCPNALLEAMASGLPVVASAVGGIPELVVDGETGLLVPPSSPASLARGIVRILGAPDWARAMGDRGRARVGARFSVRAMEERYEALYGGLLDGPGRPDAFESGRIRRLEGRNRVAFSGR